MSAQKHTPGPWVIGDGYIEWYHNDDYSGAPDAIVGPNGECVVGSSEWTHLNPHDARLIAAAPDLLAALKAVVAVADRDTEEFNAARAAIAKATGAA